MLLFVVIISLRVGERASVVEEEMMKRGEICVAIVPMKTQNKLRHNYQSEQLSSLSL